VQHAPQRARCTLVIPLLRPEVHRRECDAIEFDTRIVPRLSDDVLLAQRGKDEETGADGHLPAHQPALPLRLRYADRPRSRRQVGAQLAVPRQAERRFESEDHEGQEHRQTGDDDDPGIQLRPERDQHPVRERHVDIQRRPEGAEDQPRRADPGYTQQETLRALLAHEAPSRSTDRAANGKFLPARRPPGQHEVREVRAGDHEDERDEGHERQPEAAKDAVVVIGVEGLCEPVPLDRTGGLASRICGVQTGTESLEFSRGSLDGSSRCQASDHDESLTVPLEQRCLDLPRVGSERDPHARRGQAILASVESFGGDPDDFERTSGNVEFATNDGGIGIEAKRPERVAEHHHVVTPDDVLRIDRAPEHGTRTERVEVTSVHGLGLHQVGGRWCRDRHLQSCRSGEAAERRLRAADILVVRTRDAPGDEVSLPARREHDDAVLVGDAGRREEQVGDDGVSGGGDTKTDGERHDGKNREHRRRQQASKRQPQIAAEPVQHAERREPAGVAALFLVGLDGAELEARLPHRFVTRHPGPDEIVGAVLDVLRQLLVHLPLEARAREQRPDHRNERSHR
jgi:hypothetical protein